MNGFSTDKASIQERLYREAAEIYGRYLKQDISSLDMFDPLVLMLINACASEFKIIADEIESVKKRIIKHLAQVLTPDAYVGPMPAHGVLHATLTESDLVTDKYADLFSYPGPKGKNIFFTPVGNYQLLNGGVNYLAVGNSLFSQKNSLSREEVLQTVTGKNLPLGTVWLGVDLAPESRNINFLSFYFDVPFAPDYRRIEELLHTSAWEWNGESLAVKNGLVNLEKTQSPVDFNRFHLARQFESEVNAFYTNRFLTVFCPEGETFATLQPTSFPDELASCFGTEVLEKEFKANKLFWLKVDFSQGVFSDQGAMSQFLRQLVCLMNCFPAANKRLDSLPFSLSADINLFALRVREGYFYGIEDVRSSKSNRKYIEKPFSQFVSEEKKNNRKEDIKIYALRKEGVHRFDRRNALEMMENIFQIIREESMLYNALGKNILTNNLKTIQKAINDIGAKLNETKEEESEQRIFIAFPPAEKEYVVVRYWSTNGIEGRNIPAGESLKTVDASRTGFSGSMVRLATTTVGGRDPVLEKDHLNLFRAAMVVKDKIVTEEDIRLYCRQIAGDEIQDIGVDKGVKMGLGKQIGFIRVIKVVIKLRGTPEPQHLNYLAQKLTVELNEKSACYLPIEVFVN